jgi:hypothetical protein
MSGTWEAARRRGPEIDVLAPLRGPELLCIYAHPFDRQVRNSVAARESRGGFVLRQGHGRDHFER